MFVRCPEKQDVRLVKVILLEIIQYDGRDIIICTPRGDVH